MSLVLLYPSSSLAAVDAHADRLVLHDRAAAAAPRRDEAGMTSGIAAAHRDQDIFGAKPAMEFARFDKRMRAAVVLLVIFAVAIFADIPHSLDRSLGLGKEE